MADEKVTIEIIALDAATNVIHGIRDILTDGLATAAVAVGAAFVTAMGAAAVALSELGQAAAEAEVSQARFNALTSTSQLADFTVEMEDLATSLSRVTRFEDENILEAEAMLSVYDTISKEALPDVLNASLNLAEFMKTDATSAALALGRAFADIEGGSLSLLKRSRLLTAEQVEQAEKMAKAGDVAGAQALIIEALDEKIGNLAETMGDTAEGQWTIFTNAVGDLKEELGAGLLPVITPIIERFTQLIDQYLPALTTWFNGNIIPAVDALGESFLTLVDIMQSFFEGDFEGGGEAAVNLIRGIQEALTNVDWGQVSAQIISFFEDTDWTALGDAFGQILGAAMEAGLEIMSDILQETDWKGLFDAIAVGWARFVNSFIAALTPTMQNITATVRVGFIRMVDDAIGAIHLLVGMVVSEIYSWIAPITSALQEIKKVFFNQFLQAGQQAIRGLESIRQSVFNAVRQFIDFIKTAITAIVITVSVSLPNFGNLASKIAEGIALMQAAAGGTKGGKSTGGGSGAGAGGGCFLAGTQIKTPGGYTSIESIVPGQLVVSRNMLDGQQINGLVTKIFQHRVSSYVILNDHILTTNEHPFWIVNKKEWVRVDQLSIGNILLNENHQEISVLKMEVIQEEAMVYNIEVDEHHNYYAEGILVHNKSIGFAEGTPGWLTVPAGFPDDSYPISLSSGEKFAVIPSGARGSPEGGFSGGSPAPIFAPTVNIMFTTASRHDMIEALRPIMDEWYRGAKLSAA